MHAVTLLGLQNVKRWAMLTTFAAIENKPQELFLTALIRARFCELAGTPHQMVLLRNGSRSACSPCLTRC